MRSAGKELSRGDQRVLVTVLVLGWLVLGAVALNLANAQGRDYLPIGRNQALADKIYFVRTAKGLEFHSALSSDVIETCIIEGDKAYAFRQQYSGDDHTPIGFTAGIGQGTTVDTRELKATAHELLRLGATAFTASESLTDVGFSREQVALDLRRAAIKVTGLRDKISALRSLVKQVCAQTR